MTELAHRCSIQPSAFARSRLFSDVGDGPKIGGAALIDIVGTWNERGLHIHLRVHLTLSTTVQPYRRHGRGRHRTSFLAWSYTHGIVGLESFVPAATQRSWIPATMNSNGMCSRGSHKHGITLQAPHPSSQISLGQEHRTSSFHGQNLRASSTTL